MIQLAVVSDSHSALSELKKLLLLRQKEGIAHLAHAGDFMTEGILTLMAEFPQIHFYVAIGNCDHYGNVTAAIRRLPNVLIDSVVQFELEGKRFAVSHFEGLAEQSLQNQSIDVFIHGHTHRAKIETVADRLIVNPGSLMEGAGFMLIDVPALTVDRRFVIG